MKSFILLITLFISANAGCPNDCSGHGMCNENSACECYRDFMGNDCSERICYFSRAFVDTPQGDLNADGRIIQSTSTYRVVLGSASTIIGTHQKIKGVDAPVNDDVLGTTAAPVANSYFQLCLDTLDGADYAATNCAAEGLPAAQYNFLNDVIIEYTRNASDLQNISTNAYRDGDIYNYVKTCQLLNSDIEYAIAFDIDLGTAAVPVTQASGLPVAKIVVKGEVGDSTQQTDLAGGAGDRDIILCSIAQSTYDVQWSNRKEWEAYPTDHGVAAPSGTKNVWDEAHFYRECSNQGLCNRQTGLCECFAGFTGEGCTRSACPNDCSGHGTCKRAIDLHHANGVYRGWDAYKTQKCECDSGYSGPDCSLRLCPKGDDPITRISDTNAIQKISIANIDKVFTVGNQDGAAASWGSVGGSANRVPILFSLEFTDEFGDQWVTKSINLRAFNLASEVENALESLPNNVIEDVEVSATATCQAAADDATPVNDENTVADCSGQANTARSFNVTFLNNSGDVPLLGARFVFGYGADVDAALTAAVVKNTGNGKFGAASVVNTLDVNGVNFKVENLSVGNKENVECSNRGLCDYATGICRCFAGYTDYDCSVQNALSVG